MGSVSGNLFSKRIALPTIVETDILPSNNSGSLLMNKFSDSEGFNGYSIFISQCYTNLSTSVLSQTLYYPSMEKVTMKSYLTPANSILTLFHPLTTHCMDIEMSCNTSPPPSSSKKSIQSISSKKIADIYRQQ
jgi:hypothetical protein